ncbi:unnamed protein product [Rhizoctonia solani]|uniref:C2H2-type domain-containing protein n=1 Tax=Rhizoctonia solani TaxID=456999 RepID=A0A8H2WJQ0_9AGAM|nr:unnamed protein product [Rhizoctonia solani]
MSTMSLARRRIDIQSLTNPAPPDDDWRRSLPTESGLRASLTGTSPPRNKVIWDTPPVAMRKVDEDYEADADEGQVKVVPGEEVDDHQSEGDESSRSASASASASASCTRSPSSSPKMSAPTGLWTWPRIPNPHPSLLSAAQSIPAEIGPVRARRERDISARSAVNLPPQRTRTAAPVPVEGLTKKSRGRRVPTAVDGCGKCFHRGEHLKRHIRSIHTNERPHSCPEPDCLKTFSRHDNLIQHMKTHGRILPVLLPGESGSGDSLQQATAYRYYRPQSDVEPESEDEVGAKSDEAEAMDVDQDSSSTKESAAAPQLPSVFQSGVIAGSGVVSPLQPGRSRQTSERSIGSPQGELQCPHDCGKTFRRGEHLRRHIKGIHLAERPHACPHPGCGKTFSRHDNLMQHAKRHARPVDSRRRKRVQSTQSPDAVDELGPDAEAEPEHEFESEDEC